MVTPVRRQYLDLKARYPDAILLFRLGDFYETFDEDAKLVAQELDIALTSKPMGGGLRSPLAGVPVRSVEQHLAKLVARGHRVAICEQLEDPRLTRAAGGSRAGRGLVKRGVVRVVSPGTALEPSLLEAGEASACAAVRVIRTRRELRLGIAAADITTGAFHLSEIRESRQPRESASQPRESASQPGESASQPGGSAAQLWQRGLDQLSLLGVRELLLPDDFEDPGEPGDGPQSTLAATGLAATGLTVTRRPAHEFRSDRAERALVRQFGAPPAAFALEPDSAALEATGALLEYLWSALPLTDLPATDGVDRPGPDDESGGSATCTGTLRQLAPPRWFQPEAHLQWDAATQRALAIAERGPGEAQGHGPSTLLAVLDRCGSALGRRWLRAALTAPLLDLERAERRLDRVEALVRRPALRRALAQRLRGAPDIERLFARAASGLALPAELGSLSTALTEADALVRVIREAAPAAEDGALVELAERLGSAPAAANRLAEALVERPASEYGGGVVRPGADAESDRWRALTDALRVQLSELESALREETGIASLRVGYQRTFGYHIELNRSQAARAPESWERRQSLRDRERFSEPRLRALERDLTDADERFRAAERACVERLRAELVAEAEAVRRMAGALARLDAATSLATVAAERAWTRPALEHSGELEIEGGRHPIVEAAAAQGAFVPNDLQLADDGLRAPQLLLVTGPNMAGKSTYLRQTALIVILAQAGSFVPAERARVGLVDRIFARVGAHDDLAAGRSTFMVEMLETSRLLHGATDRSLILLDEIGRGTSTWDGLAIAQAVAESLAGGGDPARTERTERPLRGPRTLFATHFHELTALAGSLPRVGNAAVQVSESEAGTVEFLYRIAPGAADRSYGVQVAAQAGLPAPVVERARRLLQALEQGDSRSQSAPTTDVRPPALRSSAGAGVGQPGSPQLMLMPPPVHPIVADLADLDIDGITPLEAISALYALRDQARTELRGLGSDGLGSGGLGSHGIAQAGS